MNDSDAGAASRPGSGSRQPSPRNLAMNWLARREHSEAELREKLAARDFAPDIIAATVAELAADGLVSDERFAESFVTARMRKGQGPVRIRAELRRRGIGSELTQLHVDESGRDWVALAREVRSRKFGDACPGEFKEKARQMRFLEYRGFDGGQIRAAVGDD